MVLKHRSQFSSTLDNELKDKLKLLADTTKIPTSKLLDEAVELLLEKRKNYFNKYSNPNLNAVAEPVQPYIPQINLPDQETYDKALEDNSDPNELVGQYLNKHKKTQD